VTTLKGTILEPRASLRTSFLIWVNALRGHHWAKNLLLFLPLALSHNLAVEPMVRTFAGFALYGLCASGLYILNDLLDLHSDREHPWKRERPFAAGDISIPQGLLASLILLSSALGFGFLLNAKFGFACLDTPRLPWCIRSISRRLLFSTFSFFPVSTASASSPERSFPLRHFRNGSWRSRCFSFLVWRWRNGTLSYFTPATWLVTVTQDAVIVPAIASYCFLSEVGQQFFRRRHLQPLRAESGRAHALLLAGVSPSALPHRSLLAQPKLAAGASRRTKGGPGHARYPGPSQLRGSPGLGGCHRREHDNMSYSVNRPVTLSRNNARPQADTARAPSPPTERVLSWGRYPKNTHHHVHKPAWSDQVPDILRAAAPGSLLPYGLGRSYGDSCLNDGRDLIDCHRLNRILGFDESTGIATLRKRCQPLRPPRCISP